MQLESLANELLLDLFQFLNGVHLLRAFYGLNYRFDNLLFTHFRSNPLDFRRISKTDFYFVCRQHLPSFADRITSLCLSDDHETPQQTNCFLAYHLTLGQFTELQALSLSYIDSEETMDRMMDELCHLLQLRHLSITECKFQSSYVDSIWRLPRLIRCDLKDIRDIDWSDIPTVKSFSLQHLSILDWSSRRFVFDRLSEYTPCLRHLSSNFLGDFPSQQLTLMIPSIEILSLRFFYSTLELEEIVQHVPNLSQLTVETWRSAYVSGCRWETVITNHLPKLKVFRLLMDFMIKDDRNGEEQVDRILDSFRTRFWIDDHQWFVRCHKSWLRQNSYWLYTLPYAFRSFDLDINMQFKSTCSEDGSCHSYDRVHNLVINQDSLSTDIVRLRFSKLHSLDLSLLIKDDFWSVIPTFDRLTSLTVGFRRDTTISFPLQTLLDRAPRLYSLTLNDGPTLHVNNLTSKSIRRLHFISCGYFKEETCIALSRSSLGMQCEFLLIEVEDKTNIVYLVNNMKNLRALYFKCKNDQWQQTRMFNGLPLSEDELIEWFQQHLPPTCSISRNRRFPDFAQLWI